ncbi:MAG: alpha/beta hydrolase [Limosilactobacillus sp.]|uniref:alpha/beta hydrolase n=1 Tax=Limosilactobacillus sp. TaxID=2773925 RepID=UPI002709461D|nr:alpha/beta hydrolase [Limosilactobacillus sp.]
MDIRNVKLNTAHSSLDIYHSNSDVALPGVVIVPGGSYNKMMERDSERVAITLTAHAFQTFVVHYPVEENRNYQDAKDAMAEAFDYIVDHAEELKVDTDQLGVLGFSAGGQLAAAYSNAPDTKAKFAGLGYPVIRPTIDERMKVTTEDVSKLVTKQTPPTFIWGSVKDDLTTYLEHIAVYVSALAEHDIPFELHEFSTGGHGIALANKYTGIVNNNRTDDHMAKWLPLFLDWFENLEH